MSKGSWALSTKQAVTATEIGSNYAGTGGPTDGTNSTKKLTPAPYGYLRGSSSGPTSEVTVDLGDGPDTGGSGGTGPHPPV